MIFNAVNKSAFTAINCVAFMETVPILVIYMLCKFDVRVFMLLEKQAHLWYST